MRKDEQETILLTDEASDKWEIMTFNVKMQNRLDKLAETNPEICRKVVVSPRSDRQETYIVSKGCVRIFFRPPTPESVRRHRAEQLKKNLSKQKGETENV